MVLELHNITASIARVDNKEKRVSNGEVVSESNVIFLDHNSQLATPQLAVSLQAGSLVMHEEEPVNS